VLAQDPPDHELEVLVVDGRSTDGTRDLVEAVDDHRVRVLDNPAGFVPHGLNQAIAAARGGVIVRVDGHCELPPGYLARCLELLDATGADCVGGVIETRGTTVVARAIASAQSSPMGVGGVAFRTGRSRPGPVDTLAFGAYRREVFERLGGFDEELVRNQDDEFNLRITEAGGSIWLDPSLVTRYTSRATLASLWRQYEQYGRYKVRVAQKHGRIPAWRHAVPGAFVLSLLAATILAARRRDGRPLAAVLVPYATAVTAASAVAGRRDPATLPVLPAAFATLHLAYGTGSLRGLWHWRRHFRSLRGGR
jgi:GT2 family glycosyltransferase